MTKTSRNIKMQENLAEADNLPLVSIVIPFFNRENLLPIAINSVLKQTYQNWKLVLVDDGSNDNSVKVCQKYCELFPEKIILIKQKNTGPGGARNCGIMHSTGKYIALLDSDDAWKSNFLEVMVAAIESCPDVDWVYCDARRLISEEEILAQSMFDHPSGKDFKLLKYDQHGSLNLITDQNLLLTAIKSSIKCGANSIAKRNVFDNASYNTDIKVGEDRLLNIEMISKGVRYGYIRKVLLDIYSHDANTSGADENGENFVKDQEISLDLIKVYEHVKKFVYLNVEEQQGVKEKLSGLYFWLGCSMVSNNQLLEPGVKFLIKGILLQPAKMSFWKSASYCLFSRFAKLIKRRILFVH